MTHYDSNCQEKSFIEIYGKTLLHNSSHTRYNTFMNTHFSLDNLNEAQLQAVTAPLGHQLVLAGAGSGKTRVLVYRIAYLICVKQIPISQILAVTFTNKAAREMLGRIETLLGTNMRFMWVGTFHGLAHRLLSMHWRDADLPENFQVLDSEDQYRLIRRIVRELNLDENQWSPKQAQWFINAQKDEGRRAIQVKTNGDFYLETLTRIYQRYEDACQQSGLVDFAELLLRSYELWQKHPELLSHYQNRFQHILVDEFQDTNFIQYAWLKLLAGDSSYLTIVGDDDQSIYGWRGAKVENLMQASQDYAGITTIRLEQNYRSTQVILSAANALISQNPDRLGKNLWSDGEKGERIQLYSAFNEIDEARYIVSILKGKRAEGYDHRDIAILYRSNAQSRVLEEALIEAGIPYRIYGGLRFFERAEIKDALAYMRLLYNRDDNSALERIINTPTRGIGNSTIELLRQSARHHEVSLWQAISLQLEGQDLSTRAKTALKNFMNLIEDLDQKNASLPLHELTEIVIADSGLLAHFRKEKGEKGRARIENLDELITAARTFQSDIEDMGPLAGFLAHTTLEAGESQSGQNDGVQMMTLHSAKGLEFPVVIMAGMEEGLFPNHMSLEEGRLEEERRLCYVGITRAKRLLYFTFAEKRRLHGKEVYHYCSRFVREIPDTYIQEVRLKSHVIKPVMATMNAAMLDHGALPGFSIGTTVYHAKYGDGIVLAYKGSGHGAHVHVKFADSARWLIASYLKSASEA